MGEMTFLVSLTQIISNEGRDETSCGSSCHIAPAVSESLARYEYKFRLITRSITCRQRRAIGGG